MKRLLLLLALAFATGQADAEDCSLKQYASLPLTPVSRGYSVPVLINGVAYQFAVDPSDMETFISSTVAKTPNLKFHSIQQKMYVMDRRIGSVAQIPSVGLGSGTVASTSALVIPGDFPYPGVDGILGSDILSAFDAEFDLRAGRLNLFSQNHCPGNVVYWTDQFTVLPFKTDRVGHITFNMQLDGKSINTELAIYPGNASMPLYVAKRYLLSDADAEAMKPVPRKAGDDSARYRFPFKMLSLGGLSVNNPAIDIVDDGSSGVCDGVAMACYGGAELTLSLEELKKMHFYFAFGEKQLYVSAADATK